MAWATLSASPPAEGATIPLFPIRAARIGAGLALVAGLAACAAPAPDPRAARFRTETAPADAPWGAADLARNFEAIALRVEFDPATGAYAPDGAPATLSKWTAPIRWLIDGGGAQREDRALVAALGDRIAALTGLDIAEAGPDDEINFIITIATREDRPLMVAMNAEIGNDRHARRLAAWDADPGRVCAGAVDERGAPGALVFAHVFVKAETAGVLRAACLHEEMSQAMGLLNDSFGARPSIFNDDAEFAFLTEHDEALLRLLYLPELAPGMTAAEAMPRVRAALAAGAPGAGA